MTILKQNDLKKAWYIDAYHGPRKCEIIAEINDMVPPHTVVRINAQIIDALSSDVLLSEKSAYTAAWLKKLDQMKGIMDAATVMKNRADEIKDETAEKAPT